MVETKRRKSADYAGTDWWTQNFYDSAYQNNTTAGTSAEVLIATKQARLRTLLKPDRTPENEGVEDTLLDRAVYSTIALGIYREGGYSYNPADAKVRVPKFTHETTSTSRIVMESLVNE